MDHGVSKTSRLGTAQQHDMPHTYISSATVYEEQLETKFSRETENVFTLSLYYDGDGIGATPPPFL